MVWLGDGTFARLTSKRGSVLLQVSYGANPAFRVAHRAYTGEKFTPAPLGIDTGAFGTTAWENYGFGFMWGDEPTDLASWVKSNRPALSGRQWEVLAPHWALVLLTAPLPAWWLRRRWHDRRRERRRNLGQCLRCGYDLRATAGRCPECGWEAGGHGC